MADRSIEKPLVAIVGPTASGKTGLALSLAQEHDGEVVAADSRTIYRELDIGTAKPTVLEQQTVPHWGVDLIGPDERYSAARFRQYAVAAIADIRSRGKTPFLIGGTGLYVNAVIYDYSFIDVDEKMRSELESLDNEKLQIHCVEHNIALPENYKNNRHLISQILRRGKNARDEHSLEQNVHVVGIATDPILLKQRIRERAHLMFDSGAIEEASRIASLYGWEAPGLSGNIYQVARQLLAGDLSRDEAIERSATLDWQLAKRQMTWFKRDPNIKWLQLDAAEHYIAGILDI